LSANIWVLLQASVPDPAAEGSLDVAGVFAGIVVLAAFVILIDGLVTLVERRLLVWQPVAADTRT
jgi:NitT/TauT family transport system permease protein